MTKPLSILGILNILFISILSACSSMTLEGKSKAALSGTLTKHSGALLFLERIENNTVKTLDSVIVANNGSFSFNTKITDKDYYRLRVSNNNSVFIILEPEKQVVYTNPNELLQQDYTLEGSEEGALILEIKSIGISINAHRDSLMKIINTTAPEERAKIQIEMEAGFNAFVSKKLETARTIIRNNPKSLASITATELLNPDQDFQLYEMLADNLSKTYKKSGYADDFVKRVAQMKATVIGAMAPEINLPSPDGKPIALSSLRGKVVLIDFWASWCGPCRMENPNVVRLYNEKKNQGFEVYSVSLDKDKTAWMNAIEKDGLIWPSHVSDLGYWNSVVVKQYGFQGIPFTVLVGKDGKILAKGLRGEQLEEAVSKYLGE
jgi:thiol-disulfide isomerase/thioredoxin